jgi:hypothetical protein
MTGPRLIGAMARADFLERVRRHSFLVTLLFAVFLGYCAATGKIYIRLDDYRGVYTSAWIGTMVALVVAGFVSLIGFYIVKNAVDRDRITGVGEILAATPMSRAAYMLGKFLSNFLILASITAVLAVSAVVMFLLVGEDPHFDAIALLSPFLLLAAPGMALVAASAVFFEALPLLRGGVGNVMWFFLWAMVIALPLITKWSWLDPMGIWTVSNHIMAEARRVLPGYKGSFSLTIDIEPVRVAESLRYQGMEWTRELVLLRLAWVALAILLVLLTALLFDRFDPARLAARSRSYGEKKKRALQPNSAGSSLPVAVPARLTPLGGGPRANAFGRLFVAELRLALQGYRWWWYLIAAGLLIAQLASPLAVSRGPILTAAWLWPVLLWAGMGARESRFGTRPLLFSSARALFRQLPACFAAGFAVAFLTGAGAAARLLMARDGVGLFAWCAAAVFLPALALALGVVTGGSRFFEGLYVAWWYIGPLNHTPAIDFTGFANGSRTLRYAAVYLGLSVVLLGVAFFTRSRQLQNV